MQKPHIIRTGRTIVALLPLALLACGGNEGSSAGNTNGAGTGGEGGGAGNQASSGGTQSSGGTVSGNGGANAETAGAAGAAPITVSADCVDGCASVVALCFGRFTTADCETTCAELESGYTAAQAQAVRDCLDNATTCQQAANCQL